MVKRIIAAIVWVVEKIPFLRNRILRQSYKDREDQDPNIYTMR